MLKASATQSAVAGTYQIQVSSLATSSKIALQAIADPANAKFNSGTLNISVGDTKLPAITVDSSNNTLAGMRDAINQAGKEAGVSATIITDNSGSRLVLSSTKTGDGKDIKVEVSDDGSGGNTSLSQLAFDPATAPKLSDGAAAGYVTKAANGEITVDGLKRSIASNSVSDVIDGVSFDVKAVTEAGKPITLTVSRDDAGVKERTSRSSSRPTTPLTKFINERTVVTKVGGRQTPVTGALLGDASVRALVNTMRSELIASNENGSVRNLAALGITTTKGRTLEIDEKKLDKAISADFEGVASYFTGDTGLAKRLGDKMKPYTDAQGILDQRTTTLQKTLSNVDTQKADLAKRLAALQEKLTTQFNLLSAMQDEMTKRQKSITDNLASLPYGSGKKT
ncbi:flagellar filament capping protein FliD [Pseudomonas aeruginosa]|nr:flagellar filament capping protein FliD [Pseudomonas aeruginosa]